MKSGTSLLMLILAFAIASCGHKGSSNYPRHIVEVKPPLKGVDVPFKEYEVDADKAASLSIAGGSHLDIPKDAFTDADGNPVKGKVKLCYREFNNPADVIASGIPMQCKDEKGEVQQMQSAGMFEIKGSQEGKEVFLAKDKKLKVDMASQVKGDYDFFYFEEAKKEGKQTAAFAGMGDAATPTETRKGSWIKLRPPKKDSELKKPATKAFQLQFDTALYPETKSLQNIKWQFAGDTSSDPTTHPWVMKEKWTRAEYSRPKFLSRSLRKFTKSELSDSGEFGFYSIQFPLFVKKPGIVEQVNWDGKAEYTYKLGKKPVDIYSYFNRGKNQIAIASENKRFYFKDGKLKFSIDHEPFVFYWGLNFSIMRGEPGNPNKPGYTFLNEVGKPYAFYPVSETNSFNYSFCESTRHGQIAVRSDSAIIVIDSLGKVISKTPFRDTHWGEIMFSEAGDFLVLSFSESSKALNWKSRKFLYPDINKSIITYSFKMYTRYITVGNNFYSIQDKVWHWDLEANKLIEGPKADEQLRFLLKRGNYFCSVGDSISQIWHPDGRLITKDNKSSFPTRDFIPIDDKYILMSTKHQTRLLDPTGKLITDFRAMDSTIIDLRTNKGADSFITMNKSGKLSLWKANGTLLREIWLSEIINYVYAIDSKRIITVDESGSKSWDWEGNLLADMSLAQVQPNGTNYLVKNGRSEALDLRKLIHNKDSLWQLNLFTKNSTFITSVWLDEVTRRLLDAEMSASGARRRQEEKLFKSEMILLRSFVINEFGLYNWDRFYNDSNRLKIAATFSFDKTMPQENFTYFLVSGIEKNTVICFHPGTNEKFSFNPDVPNQVIVILPNNEIGIFDEKAFRDLSREKLQKEGKYNFKMKTLGKVESAEALKAMLEGKKKVGPVG